MRQQRATGFIGAVVLAATSMLAAVAAAPSAVADATAGTASAGTLVSAGTLSIGDGQCLAPTTGKRQPTAVSLQSCGGHEQHSWRYSPRDETLRIAGRCLTVDGGANATGTAVGLADCAGSRPQKWVIHPSGQLVNEKSYTCLAVPEGAPTAATPTIQTCATDDATQVWRTRLGGDTGYDVKGTAPVPFDYSYDTPAMPILDNDGTFYFQESVSNYAATATRNWLFYTGKNYDSVTKSPLSTSVNPANSKDSNGDTTWRCNTSPTGVESTYPPAGSGYTQRNFCDLLGVWVDPDTSDWYGIIHNEFTPQPFGDNLHYDGIDYAVSTDHGKTWKIKDHIITSPYSTKRGDTKAFPNETYSYGDGDPRLFVDNASGYFYLYYFSRVVTKAGGPNATEEHVARAPIAAKMAPSSWHKWHDGNWTQPGTGGKESELFPTTKNGIGHLADADDYRPTRSGAVTDLLSSGGLRQSAMPGMVIAWNSYLGQYLGRAGNNLFVTDDLATQKWVDLGVPDGYTTDGFYQFLIDQNATSNTVIGKQFRAYCNAACGPNDAQYSTITLRRTTAKAPRQPVRPGGTYRIADAAGHRLVQGAGNSLALTGGKNQSDGWSFRDNGDGFYTVVNSRTGRALAVDSTSDAGRAWGAGVTTARVARGDYGQQWAIQQAVHTPAVAGSSTGTGAYRLVNRYSGLVLDLGSRKGPETDPSRSWNAHRSGKHTGSVQNQLLTFRRLGHR